MKTNKIVLSILIVTILTIFLGISQCLNEVYGKEKPNVELCLENNGNKKAVSTLWWLDHNLKGYIGKPWNIVGAEMSPSAMMCLGNKFPPGVYKISWYDLTKNWQEENPSTKRFKISKNNVRAIFKRVNNELVIEEIF